MVSFECRMRYHEEDKEQVSPMTMVLILWSNLLFAALSLEMEPFLTGCPFFYTYWVFFLCYSVFYFFGYILAALPNATCS